MSTRYVIKQTTNGKRWAYSRSVNKMRMYVPHNQPDQFRYFATERAAFNLIKRLKLGKCTVVPA